MPNMDDMFGPEDFAEFFGGFGPGGAGGRRAHQQSTRAARTADANITINVTMEDLYKGKVFKMNSIRDVLCKACSGKGGKPKAKEKKCHKCNGHGVRETMRRVGPGLVTQDVVQCETCRGIGLLYRDKDKCKKCGGGGIVEEKTVLEVYVPRGGKDGQRIVMQGKADEEYGKKTGALIFTVSCAEHEQFQRRHDDLWATCTITLAEALCGFQRILLTHLDGRGIQVTSKAGKVLRPDDVLVVKGEGMPKKKVDARGDLYIILDIKFPEDGWCMDRSELRTIQDMLPTQPPKVSAKEVDDVDFTITSSKHLPEYEEEEQSDDGMNGHDGGGVPDCSTM